LLGDVLKTIRLADIKLSGLIAIALALCGCAYRLPVSNLPSQQLLKPEATFPERYAVRVEALDAREFPVGSDGRVKIDVPMLPRACSVYLFDWIRISRGVQPVTSKSIHVIDPGNIVAKLSLSEIDKLPLDASGYHILKSSSLR
jgi:hypothetical protein